MTFNNLDGRQIYIVGSAFSSADVLKFARENAMTSRVAAAILSQVENVEAGVELARRLKCDAAETKITSQPDIH